MNDTVADLIKYLETLPPTTKVEVVTCSSWGYMGLISSTEALDIEVNTTFYGGLGILTLGNG
jgi:hypothetical protein